METATVTDYRINAYALANMADCATPDTPDSEGAAFLYRVLDSFDERAEDLREAAERGEEGDVLSEIADQSANIVYTHTIWTTFVDLAGYRELPDIAADYGEDFIATAVTKGSGQYGAPDALAVVALYVIAERLARALFESGDHEE